MINLAVYIEKNGTQVKAGNLVGNIYSDTRFSYDECYISDDEAMPISIALPIQNEPFSPERTTIFFEGLLPEGFSRRAVAEWIHEDENDYIAILHELGKECLGAIRIVDEEDKDETSQYEKLSLNKVRELAKEGATKSTELLLQSHLSLTGASGKVGLYSNDDGKTWYLPKGSAPSTHILKQSHVRLNDIVINEQLAINTARVIGLNVVESKIVDTGTREDSGILFSTKRYDRIVSDNAVMIGDLPCPMRLHQEDFAQAMGIPARQKYERTNGCYMKKMFDVIRRKSLVPMEDMIRLWDIIVFNYLIGNTDAHIKNHSLLYVADLRGIRLAPAYDIVSTVIYKESTRQMSFSIGGEYSFDKLSREHFKLAAKEVGLGEKIALERYDEICESFTPALFDSAGQLETEGYKKATEIAEKIKNSGVTYG